MSFVKWRVYLTDGGSWSIIITIIVITVIGFVRKWKLHLLITVEDLERNDGSPEKPYYMSTGLKKILRKGNKEVWVLQTWRLFINLASGCLCMACNFWFITCVALYLVSRDIFVNMLCNILFIFVLFFLLICSLIFM